jgi:TfoX/Sxy family transcriptional regulator of competence genes
MAFDEALAEEVRALLSDRTDVGERRMFGGLTFMVNGHMCCGITSDELMLRLGSEGAADALAENDARPMDFTGRPMKSFVAVSTDGLSESRLEWWVSRAVAFASGLPSK